MSIPESTQMAKEALPPTDKKQERTSIVELRNGRVIFKQKPWTFEKQSETLQEIVKFRSMLEERVSRKEAPLSEFPEEHKPLIAKLAHESDKTLATLGKHIHHELLPTVNDDEDEDIASATSEALPFDLVERTIREIMVRNNYGIELPSGVKPPAALCVWRWEVKTNHLGWLPKNGREKAEARLAERIQAKEELRLLFEALSPEERKALTDPKGVNKLPTKELNKPDKSQLMNAVADDDKPTFQSSKKEGKRKAEESENDNVDGKNVASRPKKPADSEKAAKEKERLEKRAVRIEKEKKEKEAHNKSQNLMAKFFSRAKVKSPTKNLECAIAGPSRVESDFEKVFKPFVLQKDKVLAPTNWFRDRMRFKSKTGANFEVITVDCDEDEDVDMHPPQPIEQELEGMSPKERLDSILSTLPASAMPGCGPPKKPGYQVYNAISVRDLVSQLSEAEVCGNDELVRAILSKLEDRDLLPAKAFCFHEDARPGYFGTWTRNSRIIGPRRPFVKDTLVFDYGYDSGEEWEEEPAGEDVAEDGEDEDVEDDDADSDLESWLVDDDEEQTHLSMLSRNSTPPPLIDMSINYPPKRKAEDSEKKIGKKRKVVVPLVPFIKGPVFESVIGRCDYEPFQPYAIQLFNDTPMSIDPFSFISTCLEDCKEGPRDAASSNVVRTPFVVPALPSRFASSADGSGTDHVNLPSNSPSSNSQGSKKAAAVPKAPFPDAHIQFLLDKITQLQASSISALVESIHLELREHKVRKNAIEAKIREVSEKCNEKKMWVVKPALLQQAVKQ